MKFFGFFRKKEKKPFQPFQLERVGRGSFDEFLKSLRKNSLIILITGKRGSGKSALGMTLLQLLKESGRKCWVLGYEKAKLPGWIKKAENLENLPANSAVLVDEGALAFFSRDAMKQPNKVLSKLMAIARHKDLSLILISQSSAMIDLNVLRLADVVILKEPSLLQAKFERKAIREMYEKVEPIFKQVQEREKYAYIYSDSFEGLISFSLPDFWSERLSKA